MRCSVGVVTYDRPDCVARVLASLRRQTRTPGEVVIVDDSPSRATETVVERVRDDDPPFDLEFEGGDPRTAQPGARNTVLERATGDVICFVDDDVYCEPTWLETIHDVIVEREAVVGVGGPAVLTDETLEPRYDWYLSTTENLNRINEHAEDVELAEFWIPTRPVETDFLLGANMAFRADALEAIGGFDTAYRWGPAYYEETDVMAALRRRGEVLLYHPDAMVCHVQSESGGSRTSDARKRSGTPLWFSHNHIDPYWFAHNHVLFAAKHARSFPLALLRLLVHTELRPAPLWRHVLDGLRRRDLSDATAMAAGYLDGLRRFGRS